MAIKTALGAKRRLHELEREAKRLESITRDFEVLPADEKREARSAALILVAKVRELEAAARRLAAEGRLT